MSYLVQMLGLTHQNYLSGATGIVLALALIRGFARQSVRTVGNFWVDITRCTLYILVPICVAYALFLISQAAGAPVGIARGALEAFMTRRFERCRMVIDNSRTLARWDLDPDVPGDRVAELAGRTFQALGSPI